MKIYVDTQKAFDYFTNHVMPFGYDPCDDEIVEETQEWFDSWINWLVGSLCLNGNDINYEYILSEASKHRLNQFGIEFEVRGDERALPESRNC